MPIKLHWITLDAVEGWPDNPKGHDIESIKDSIRRFGFTSPILLDEKSGRVVAGHGRIEALRAMRDAGEMPPNNIRARGNASGSVWAVPYIKGLSFDSESEAEAYLLADNRLTQLGGWNYKALTPFLQRLIEERDEALNGTGFSQSDLTRMLTKNAATLEEDTVPETPKKPCTETGDIWVLGRHRLICGDSTDKEIASRVLGDRKADLVVTDPLYNLAGNVSLFAKGLRESYSKLKESKWDQSFDFSASIPILESSAAASASFYVFTSSFLASDVMGWMNRSLGFSCFTVWSKINPVPSLARRHWTMSAELCCYGTRGKHTFNFPMEGHAKSVWEFSNISKGRHPTQKPVELIAHIIRHSSNPGQAVFDPFMGSGTTLAACEQLDRTCYGIEMDPGYCDVIVDRWEALTGEKAERGSTD